ncbi:MAG: effector binding domain-containing protein [Candidatus Cloacimonetes bacterium]|nr:effector binding domain-containing protein [Candidatus Cloacimonadota bacterium]
MQAELTAFKVIEIKKCKIIGKSIRCSVRKGQENPIPAFWDKCFSDGTIDGLEKRSDLLYQDVLIGWCGDYNPENHFFTYLIGVFVESSTEVPENLTAIEIATTKYAAATIEGQEPDIYMMAHDLTFKMIEEKGLEYNPDRGFEFEWYDERFCQDDNKRVIDLYVTIK